LQQGGTGGTRYNDGTYRHPDVRVHWSDDGIIGGAVVANGC